MPLSGATIAFDLDGTLVETAPDLVGALNVVLGERGLAPLTVEQGRLMVGRGARNLVQKAFRAGGVELDEAEAGGLTARYIEVYATRLAAESRAFPGLEAALDALIADGATLAVCTNKRTDLSVALLEALGLSGRFAAVIGADQAPTPKPDPAHFIHTIQAAGGDPARALMVGDSLNDVASAQGAGSPVVVVSFGYTDTPAAELGAEALIDHFDELPAAARRLLDRREAEDRRESFRVGGRRDGEEAN